MDASAANVAARSRRGFPLIDSDMAGAKIVRVSTSRKVLGLNVKDDVDGGESGPLAERVPAIYNKKSRLFTEVTPGKTFYDFDLKRE